MLDSSYAEKSTGEELEPESGKVTLMPPTATNTAERRERTGQRHKWGGEGWPVTPVLWLEGSGERPGVGPRKAEGLGPEVIPTQLLRHASAYDFHDGSMDGEALIQGPLRAQNPHHSHHTPNR